MQSIKPLAGQPPCAAPEDGLRTESEAKAAFMATGTTVADWARQRGFSEALTRMVLAGKRKCLRGQSHQIAVALRLKPSTCDQQ
ncbi:DNA-binding protein [Pulveribacter sp.]|uniref:DNA-binding protein n=1 Tax=Pulveribacter sp. TaxID=2678893 RepID=UPI003917EA49